jgi:hypothetical protein
MLKPEPNNIYEETRHRLRWLVTMPPIDPPIDRPCMAAPMAMPTRLALQVTGRTVIRDCCRHHTMDWRKVSATAVTLARRLRREHIRDRGGELFDRAIDLTHALSKELSEDQQGAVLSLLCPGDGIMVGRMGGHRELSYQNGRHRTYAMLEAGVRRTVVIEYVVEAPLW